MVAIIERQGLEVDAIDVFCGYGGSSQGIHAAGATVRAAANHSELAIECANFPDVDHWQADLSDANNPQVINRRGKKVSGRYLDPADLPAARYAWFSPSCKHHSQANAKKVYLNGPSVFDQMSEDPEFDQEAYANSERSRVSMMCVLRYAAAHHPNMIAVENVVEAAKWGPNRDGSTFRWWLKELHKLGYQTECLFLNSMFFPPCPQSRDRMYVVAWRGVSAPNLDYRPTAYCTSDICGGELTRGVQTWKQRTSAWPLPKWGKYNGQYIYTCERCHKPVEPATWPAYSAIDWSNLGPMLGERSALGMRPLADKTVDRIRRGLAKFRGGPPIIIPAKSMWGVDRYVTDSFTTQTTQRDKALVSFLVKNNGKADETKYRARSISGPIGTVTSSPAQALCTEGVVLPVAGNTHERPAQTRVKPLHQPLYTQHTTLSFGFAHTPFLTEMRGGGSIKAGQHPITDPAHTVTAGGFHHGLASPGIFAKFNGGPEDTAWHGVHEPFGTITAGGNAGIDPTGLVVLPWLEQFQSDPVAVTEQLATVMTHLRHALASIEELPLDRITDDDLQSVRFRMLDPDPELRRAMAFGDTYILLGSKTDMTAGLGNAVTPPVSAWVTEQCLAVLRDEVIAA